MLSRDDKTKKWNMSEDEKRILFFLMFFYFLYLKEIFIGSCSMKYLKKRNIFPQMSFVGSIKYSTTDEKS